MDGHEALDGCRLLSQVEKEHLGALGSRGVDAGAEEDGLAGVVGRERRDADTLAFCEVGKTAHEIARVADSLVRSCDILRGSAP